MTQEIPQKPRDGAACNGCGLCCALELCGLAVEFLGAGVAPCPALEFSGARFWCGLAKHPSRYLGLPSFSDKFTRPLIYEALGIGEGCDTEAAPAHCTSGT